MDIREIYEGINEFIDLVIPEYNPEQIILYGSYAKGTNHQDSDIDIAVVVNEVEGSFLEKESRLYKLRRNIDSNIEPILIEKNNDRSGFLEHILSYGTILFVK